MNGPAMNFDDTLELVSEFLMHNQFHLSALELRQELADMGLNHPSLDDFFSNPANDIMFVTDPQDLRASSNLPKGMLPDFVAPFGPDSAHSAIVARDERVSVLEYEMRIAAERHAEEIALLRAELQEQAVGAGGGGGGGGGGRGGAASPDWGAGEGDDDDDEGAGKKGGGGGRGRSERAGSSLFSAASGASGREQRMLNCMVKRFLMDSGYKSAAIAFCADVGGGQDLDDLVAVDLDIGRRAELLALLQNRVAGEAGEVMRMETSLHRSKAACSRLEADNAELRFRVAEVEDIVKVRARERERE